jgi:hypothetical protein
MTPIPLIHNDDLYRVYVDEFNDIVKIELYPENKNVRPEEIEFDQLDPGLKNRIVNKVMKVYGFKPNTGSGDMHPMRPTNHGRDGSSERERSSRAEIRARQLLTETNRPMETGGPTV